jgi:Ca-activated chloride channel homolog
VSITLDLAACPWNAAHHLARIGIQARKTDPADMPPRNFVFLVDTSGSMFEPLRLPLFQKGLNMLTDRLTARDRVAIVTYAGSSFTALPSTRGDQKERIHHAIDALSAAGSTNGGAGIQTAYQVAKANFIQGGVNRVILGTDGDFNVGVTGEELIRLVEAQRKSGVFLTVLGFGKGNLKDAEMEELSYRGNGHYAYVDGENELRKVFVEQGGALQAVAKDVKLQVEFNPRRVGAYRLIGYENRLLRDQDFNDDAKQGGAMGAGHTVTALYEIVPAGLPLPVPGVDPLKYQSTPVPTGAADNGDWLTVKMRYKDPESDASKELIRSLTGSPKKLTEAPADFRFAAATVEFGQLMRGSDYKGDATYAAVRALAKEALGSPPDGRRAEFLLMIDAAERLSVRRGDEERKP